jgi:hypothetical protein
MIHSRETYNLAWETLATLKQRYKGGCEMKKNNPKQQDANKDRKIEARELFVVSETPIDDKGRNHKVRAVVWQVDGVQGKPKFEKRGFYAGRNGQRLTSKEIEALSVDDLKALAPQLNKVIETMENGVFAR